MTRVLSNLLSLRCRCWGHRSPARGSALVDEEGIRQLRERWTEFPERVTAILGDIRDENDWTQNLLKNDRWPELPRLQDCPAEYRLSPDQVLRDLRGIRLIDKTFEECDAFANSCMDFCILENVLFNGGSLVATSMESAEMRGSCAFTGTKMRNTKLRHALCKGVSFRRADLKDATLQGADLRGADLRDCVFRGTDFGDVKFVEEPWCGHLFRKPVLLLEILVLFVVLFAWSVLGSLISLSILVMLWLRYRERWTRFGGDFQSPELLVPDPGTRIRRFVSNENHRRSIMSEHRILGILWYILADCGWSPGRLLFWALVTWFAFAAIYTPTPIPVCLEGTFIEPVLYGLVPTIEWTADKDKPWDKRYPSWYEPYYFSVVTMTTLGYGDIHPAPKNTPAQIYTSLEAVAGHVLLGALVATLLKRHSM